ncbi:MAG: hypothetical protein JWN82_111 [Candidatus Saccharibacteria bacterium]|nr:hypothetical protein [Candidatus Saccharibacteria bacterium]
MKLFYLKTVIFVAVVICTLKIGAYVSNDHPTVWSGPTFIGFCVAAVTLALVVGLKYVRGHYVTIAMTVAAVLGVLIFAMCLSSYDVLRLVVICGVFVALWALSVFGHNLISRKSENELTEPTGRVPDWETLRSKEKTPVVLGDTDYSITLIHGERD